ncbi:hypothetical protein L6452_36042 [Arctium lappa]|uniref:Uncharacterized protein n=1 Tax=Arctium lappa TaxID=4217 RepID=A0ACB8Y9H7_ARCLA|nr:hypothetical protein L6452_36042 [Arctium lappa]
MAKFPRSSKPPSPKRNGLPKTYMASTTTTTTTGDAAVVIERLTYHCHSCNSDVSPSPFSSATTSPLLCPHCNSDCLEERLLSNNNPNPNPNYTNQNSSQLSFPSFFDSSVPATTADSRRTFPFPSVTTSDDNFLLDSPYLHRLIHHLTNSDDSSPSTTTTTTTTSLHHSPAAKSAVEAIPLIKITSAFLDIDPIVFCAVCKDQFVIDDETKQLPCKHMYHPDCILPWLSQHNSCPVCRFQLPKESLSRDLKVRRRSRSRVFRLGDLMEDVDDEAMLGIGFSHLHHQYLESEVDPNVMFPLTHIGETIEVDVLPDSGQGNGLETASSWSNWRGNGRADDGGEIGVNAGWVDDTEAAMP